MRILSLLVFTFTLLTALCQKIDNTASFREIINDTYLKMNYENDLFARQDENYTQGFSLEFVSPFLQKNPLNKMLVHFKNDERRSGISIEHIAYTPFDYASTEIQKGDRPFSSAALFKSFNISKSTLFKQRIASHVSFGIMGPAAQGKEIQTGIHRITGSTFPNGWKNQIENHFVLNYGIDYEKQIIHSNNYFGLDVNAKAKLGNLFTNASLGFNTVFGLIKSANQTTKTSSKNFLLYGYIQPLINFIAYDGTLQGEIFRKNSIYTIANSDINRAVGQINYGLVLQMNVIYFEYSGTGITQEVKTLGPASWGGFKIGFRL